MPDLLSAALRPLPLPPLQVFLQQLADSIAVRHPGIIERIGHAGVLRFGIEPSDVPFAVRIELSDGTVRLQVLRQLHDTSIDARISGTLAALIALVDGNCDGDALFFSRDIVVDGDIAAVLALRNAIDDAEIKLLREAMALAESWVIRSGDMLRELLAGGYLRPRGARTGPTRP